MKSKKNPSLKEDIGKSSSILEFLVSMAQETLKKIKENNKFSDFFEGMEPSIEDATPHHWGMARQKEQGKDFYIDLDMKGENKSLKISFSAKENRNHEPEFSIDIIDENKGITHQDVSSKAIKSTNVDEAASQITERLNVVLSRLYGEPDTKLGGQNFSSLQSLIRGMVKEAEVTKQSFRAGIEGDFIRKVFEELIPYFENKYKIIRLEKFDLTTYEYPSFRLIISIEDPILLGFRIIMSNGNELLYGFNPLMGPPLLDYHALNIKEDLTPKEIAKRFISKFEYDLEKTKDEIGEEEALKKKPSLKTNLGAKIRASYDKPRKNLKEFISEILQETAELKNKHFHEDFVFGYNFSKLIFDDPRKGNPVDREQETFNETYNKIEIWGVKKKEIITLRVIVVSLKENKHFKDEIQIATGYWEFNSLNQKIKFLSYKTAEKQKMPPLAVFMVLEQGVKELIDHMQSDNDK